MPDVIAFDAILFDFDGVLIESEYVGNRQIAEYLTRIGYPISAEESMRRFMGLAGSAFIAEIEQWLGRRLPEDFHAARAEEDRRVMEEGVEAVAGAVAFIHCLPDDLPKAIASSSSTAWIERHLDHIALRDHFGDRIFSGREHVRRGKPAPDLYLHAAEALGVAIDRTLIIEDSPVGVKGALASGAQVIGLCAGSHCLAGHDESLRALGVRHIAHDFAEIEALIGLDCSR